MHPMVLPLQPVLQSQVGGFQNQKILRIARGRRVGEVKATRDDHLLVNHHHLVVNCKLNHVT